MNHSSLVSVVVASYNQQQLLARALQSVLSQTYSPIEIIVVDDGSTDGSREWIEQKAEEYPERLRYHFQEQNVGIPKNKNTGFKLAKGDFITYLDGDDTYYPEKVEREIEVFRNHPEFSVVYSNFDIKTFEGERIKVWSARDALPQGDIFRQVVLAEFPSRHMPRFEMFRRDLMHELNFYDESFPIYEDLDFMVRYSSQYLVGSTANVGSSYYMNPGSIVSSTKQWRMTSLHRRVYLNNREKFKEKGLESEYNKYLKEVEIKLLFAPPKIRLREYFAAFLSQPLKAFQIAKAFYFSIRMFR